MIPFRKAVNLFPDEIHARRHAVRGPVRDAGATLVPNHLVGSDPALLARLLSGSTTGSSSTGFSSGTATSGTTAGGIQYSTADMSMFTKDASHGTIALYYCYGGTRRSTSTSELVGPNTDGNKAAMADALAEKVNSSTPFIGFEPRSGDYAAAEAAIRQKSGSSVSAHCQGEYRGER